jgi:TPR repeat protein
MAAALVEGAAIRPPNASRTAAGPKASPASAAIEARTASNATSRQTSPQSLESAERERALATGEAAAFATLATPAVRAAADPSPLSTPDRREPDRAVVPARPNDTERLVARGESHLASGNIAVARQFFLRAAEAGSARGALLLAATYDPYELDLPEIVGVLADRALAVSWYRRAQELGAALAAERLARLDANAP